MPAISTKKPTKTISLTLICPLEYTMVLGAVAMGNMKPKEADNAAGTNRSLGSMSETICNEIKMGIIN